MINTRSRSLLSYHTGLNLLQSWRKFPVMNTTDLTNFLRKRWLAMATIIIGLDRCKSLNCKYTDGSWKYSYLKNRLQKDLAFFQPWSISFIIVVSQTIKILYFVSNKEDLDFYLLFIYSIYVSDKCSPYVLSII